MKRLIFTTVTGNFQRIGEITLPSIEAYAKKVSADLVVTRDVRYDQAPLMEKLRVRDYLDHYDRVLAVDVDLVFRNDCPDLFNLVPPGSFAAYDEGAVCSPNELIDRRRSADCYLKLCGKPPIPWKGASYFNTGIFLADKSMVQVFEEPSLLLPVGLADQNLINAQILYHDIPTFSLPATVNSYDFHAAPNWKEQAYVFHAAGHSVDKKIQILSDYLEFSKKIRNI